MTQDACFAGKELASPATATDVETDNPFFSSDYVDPEDGPSFEAQMQELHDLEMESVKPVTKAVAKKAAAVAKKESAWEELKAAEAEKKAEREVERREAELRQAAVPYSPAVMVQLIVDNPTWTHKRYAAHFGYTPGWFSSVLASDNFQLLMDARRSEVADPSLTATLEERFRALTLRSLSVLQVMLDNPKVQDSTVLKAAEIGIKALGLGQRKDEEEAPKAEFCLDNLADRLTNLLKAKGREMFPSPTDLLLKELGTIDQAMPETKEA